MFRPLPVLTGLTLICLVILVMLGNWQYARFSEKMAAAPLEQAVLETATVSADVLVTTPGNAQQVYGVLDGEPVWRRYVPARLASGETVFVLWDATGGPDPVPLSLSDLRRDYDRQANILSRPVTRSRFAAADQPEADLWYTMDLPAMSAHLSLEPPAARVVETLLVTVRKADDESRSRRTENPYAFEKVRDPLPPQRHFGYALTWWGMAMGLIGVYLAFHHSRGRLRFRR
ncbi:MAG: SURF1 family cytochrome oxidase biogenesis protein [Henriciella sp.]|nr:SURF1 family cytochrome oxidase biogenesis protein [Henriciella sp.]